MNAAKMCHKWEKFIRVFDEENRGRISRLGMFESHSDVVDDYWIKGGEPFTGMKLDLSGDLPAVEITVGDYVHPVHKLTHVSFRFGISGEEDGVDITDANGRTTVLRFEPEGC